MTVCELCGEDKGATEEVMVYTGRDYPGVGGGITPPEYGEVCYDCLDEEAKAE